MLNTDIDIVPNSILVNSVTNYESNPEEPGTRCGGACLLSQHSGGRQRQENLCEIEANLVYV